MVDNDFQLRTWGELSVTKSLIPLKGKEPFEKDWQRFCIEKKIFESDSFKGFNAGIACGPASNSLVVEISFKSPLNHNDLNAV